MRIHRVSRSTNNIDSLICQENKLTSLDVTGCPNLHCLYCNENDLTSLDISKCSGLVEFIDTVNREVYDEGSYRYYDYAGGKYCLVYDKEIELVTS